jgi:hypothetical protein
MVKTSAFGQTMVATGILGMLVTGLYLAGGSTIRAVSGDGFNVAGGGLVWFSLGATFYALANVCMTMLCINDRPTALWPGLLGWAAFLAGAGFRHGSVLSLSLDYLLANGTMAFTAVFLVICRKRPPARQEEVGGP